MVSCVLCVKNEEGLHSRPATDFSALASTFASSIVIHKDDMEFNAKSVLKVLSACICQNDAFELVADGPDEAEAVAALKEMVEAL